MRILAVDVGKRRIGIAVSDPLGLTARPHSTLERNREAAGRIASLALELEAGLVLVGLPLHLDGSESEQAKDVRKFASRLQAAMPGMKIKFVDERLSTVEAMERMSDRRGGWRKNKNRLDAFAAAMILESYLNEQ